MSDFRSNATFPPTKPRRRLWPWITLGVVSILVIGAFVAVRGETSFSVGNYPQFTLYNLGKVSSARISGPSGIFEIRGLAPESGQHLAVTVKGDTIEIPWTMYLPVYQFGTIVGRRTFDVSLSQVIKSDDTVEIRSNVSSFSLIPRFSREDEVRKQLNSVLIQGIRARVEEGNKVNRDT